MIKTGIYKNVPSPPSLRRKWYSLHLGDVNDAGKMYKLKTSNHKKTENRKQKTTDN